LEEQAFLFGRWSEALEEKGKLQEAKIHREKTISCYRQCNILLFAHLKSEDTGLKKSSLKKRLALSLNNLCYQLNRAGQYEEALQLVEHCIVLKEQGYTQFGALAAAYGEKSQILAALGRFREALLFDDKAIAEIERFARLGHRASQEEMDIALAGIGQVLKQGLSHPDTVEVSQRLIRLLRENLHLSLDLSYSDEEAQTLQKEHSSFSPPQRLVGAQTAKRFFEAVLYESGYAGWQVIIDPKTSSPRVETGLRQLFLPDEALSLERIQHYLAHELAGHVARAVAGETSLLGLLGINTKGYMPTEEGIALYQERHVARLHGQVFDDSVV